jgi:hypothetical protein
MNSKERVALAMAHQKPDRVPVMCQLSLGHYFIHSGFDPVAIWFDTETFIRALLERQRTYGFDGILINLPSRPHNWKDYIKIANNINGKKTIEWTNGLKTVIPPDDNPISYTNDMKELPRASINDITSINAEIFRISGYVWNTWHSPSLWGIKSDCLLNSATDYPEWYTNGLKIARTLAPEISIHVEVFSPFTHLMEFFGYQNTLMALVDKPQLCHKLLSVFTRQAMAQIDCYAPLKPDAVLVSSAFAGAGFISREYYLEFVVEYERKIADHINLFKIPSYVHTCGAIGDRLDLMAETHVQGIDTLDPPPLGTVELSQAKSQYGERFFFKGNLDSVNELLYADERTFESAVKQRLAVGMPDGGYILSTACSVAPHVKPERLKKLVEITKQYGCY